MFLLLLFIVNKISQCSNTTSKEEGGLKNHVSLSLYLSFHHSDLRCHTLDMCQRREEREGICSFSILPEPSEYGFLSFSLVACLSEISATFLEILSSNVTLQVIAKKLRKAFPVFPHNSS